MSLLNVLENLYNSFINISNEYNQCKQNIEVKEQFKIPINERMTKVSKMLQLCKDTHDNKIEDLLNSDIRYNKYKHKHNNMKCSIKTELYTKDIVNELSNKYSNILIDNDTFCKSLDIHMYEPSYIDKQYKKAYIHSMVQHETSVSLYEKYWCLDKKIIEKYREVLPKYSPYSKNVIQDIIVKYPEISDYPTHQEYLQCSALRKKLEYELPA